LSFACYATCPYTPIRAVLSYSECYLTLGATPDTDWETLRANYRRLIGRWHPDRFSGDAVSKGIAEERSKQITLAYQTLEKYRRDHGALPPTKPAAVTAQGPAMSAEPMSERPASEVRVEPAKTGPAVREFAKRRPVRRVAIALAFFVLIGALYLAPRYQDERASDDDRPAASAHDPGVATPAPRLKESPRDSPGISTGSTLGEVYAIQGVPTLTQGDTWHYGNSQIRFAQGKVISWKEHPDDPLRIVRDQSVQPHGTTFDVGSTKEEVRAIQGTPVRETDTLWDYAPSRVYFRHDRVIRWEESPVQPLRVPR
jgi:hypothetical protein